MKVTPSSPVVKASSSEADATNNTSLNEVSRRDINEQYSEFLKASLRPPSIFQLDVEPGWVSLPEAAFLVTGFGEKHIAEFGFQTNQPATIEQCIDWLSTCSKTTGYLPEELQPIDAYNQLILAVNGGKIKAEPFRSGDPNGYDPRRTLIKYEDAEDFIKAFSGLEKLQQPTPSPVDFSASSCVATIKVKRRPAGLNFQEADQALVQEIRDLVAAGTEPNIWMAALKVAHRAKGAANIESKAKRLIGRIKSSQL